MQMQPIGNIAPRELIESERPAVTPSTAKVAKTAEPANSNGAAEPSPAIVAKAVDSINETMRTLSQGIEFSIDEDSKRLVVKVVDQHTGDVIRQMPSAEALEIAKALDRLQGLLIRQQA